MSQNRQHLVPTPLTNKNGVPTTVYKKPATGPLNKTQLPNATLPTNANKRKALILEITHAISAAHTPFHLSMHPKEKIIKALTPFSNATLEKIQQCEWTAEKVNTFTFGIRNSWDETKTNDYLAVSQALADKEPDGVPALHHSTWIEYHELHPANNEGEYPEERLSQLLAIYHVINDMFDQDEYADEWDEIDGGIDEPYLAPTPLRDLIINPGPNYNREDIIRIITTHHTYDPERIKAMLDHGIPAMTSGVI